MNALRYAGKRRVCHEAVPDPVMESPTDVIVHVRLAGICGSDLHVYHDLDKGLDPGTVMGHEFVGEIVDAGAAVENLKKGDPVFGPFSTSCGTCFYCRKGLTSRCPEGQLFGWVQNGAGLQGVQAEYARVPLADSTLMVLPEDVTAEEGLLLGDVLSTGYFCAEMAQIEPDGIYVIIGCGPVGAMAIVGAKHLGAERLFVVDSIPERLNLAKTFGAVPIDQGVGDPVDVVRQATEGRGADAVLEAVGSTPAVRLAVELVRPGGTIASVGVHTDQKFGLSAVEAYAKNLTFTIGRCPARHYMERLLPMVQEKKIPLSSVISHRLPLSEGVRGYEIFDKKLDGCTKVVLMP